MQRKDSPLRAGISVRVSKVGNRPDLASPEIQEKAARGLIAREGWTVAPNAVYVDIDASAFGGKSLENRDDFRRLLDDTKAGQLDVIVIYESARIGRDEAETFTILRDLMENGVQSVRGVIDGWRWSKGEDNFAAGINVLVDAEFSRKMSKRWHDAHARRISQGKPKDGTARFGYVYDREAKEFRPDPVTGPALREAYLRYIGGAGFLAIVSDLNEKGIRSTRGNPLHVSGLSRALDSGFGAGKISTNKDPETGKSGPRATSYLDGTHEPVITPDEWTLYLARRKKAPSPQQAKVRSKWHLAGLVRHGECGGLCGVDSYTAEHSLVLCRTYKDKGKGACSGVWWKRAKVEWIAAMWLGAHVEEWNAATPDPGDERRVALEASQEALSADLTALEAERVRLGALVVKGVLDEQDYAEQRARIDAEKAELVELLEAARTELAEQRADGDVYEALIRKGEGQTPGEFNAVLRRVIESVTLWADYAEIRDVRGNVVRYEKPPADTSRPGAARTPQGRFTRSDRN